MRDAPDENLKKHLRQWQKDKKSYFLSDEDARIIQSRNEKFFKNLREYPIEYSLYFLFFMAPLIFGFSYPINSWHFENFFFVFKIFAASFAVLYGAYAFLMRQRYQKNNSSLMYGLKACLLGLPLILVLFLYVDIINAFGVPERNDVVLEGPVVKKDDIKGKGGGYFVTIDDPHQPIFFETRVREKLYHTAQIGNVVTLLYTQGRLGIPFQRDFVADGEIKTSVSE